MNHRTRCEVLVLRSSKLYAFFMRVLRTLGLLLIACGLFVQKGRINAELAFLYLRIKLAHLQLKIVVIGRLS